MSSSRKEPNDCLATVTVTGGEDTPFNFLGVFCGMHYILYVFDLICFGEMSLILHGLVTLISSSRICF